MASFRAQIEQSEYALSKPVMKLVVSLAFCFLLCETAINFVRFLQEQIRIRFYSKPIDGAASSRGESVQSRNHD